MEKEHILLITTDQQRFDTIQALGNSHIYTPHLNWLVDQGITFTRCYADSPVCMPSRATIMTGKTGYSLGLVGNSDSKTPLSEHQTLPGMLTRMGYQTRAQGKMHFHPTRANYGFEHMELPMDYYREMNRNEKNGIPKAHGVGENEVEPVISTVHETQSLTYWTAKRSVDFIETRDETRSFFLWTSFAKPHPPFDPCLNYWQLYDNREVPDPIYGEWSKDLTRIPQGFMDSTYKLNNVYRMSKEQIKDMRRAYYACITQIDYSLGIMFARLREMDLLDKTWIIFTADHGDMLGDHHMGAKSIFLEGSAHIPMIIKPPDTSEFKKYQGGRREFLVTLSDLMPTMEAIALGIANCEIEGYDGKNVLAMLDGQAKERTFYGQNEQHFCIMEEGYKYMWTGLGGDELLFHMETDEKEQNDLSKNLKAKEVLARFRENLLAFCSIHAPKFVENGALKPGPKINGPGDVEKWPGFHSTIVETDVLH